MYDRFPPSGATQDADRPGGTHSSPGDAQRSEHAGGFGDLIKQQESELGAIEIPELSLPKGGGALRGIDEKFAVNPSNGTVSLSVALGITANRDGFTPKLGLSYSSGAGNGPFGLGWSLDLAAIQRKTEKGIPRYLKDDQDDVFVLSGADDLVPRLIEQAPGQWQSADLTVGNLRIRTYRPRIAGDLNRIERISHPVNGEYWKITDRTNVVTFYGRRPETRLAHPDDPHKIFRWLPDLSFDNKGNCIVFEYKAEDLGNVPNRAGEAHRLAGAAFSNMYLKRVFYCNHEPYFADPARPYEPEEPAQPGQLGAFHFEVVLDYGEHDEASPSREEAAARVWSYRPDAFSFCRSGFEIRTARLCRRVLMFHHFPDEDVGTDCLVRSVDLTYSNATAAGTAQDQLVRLVAAEQAGYVQRPDGSYSRKALPRLEFSYQEIEWNRQVHAVAADGVADAPTGGLAPYRIVDLYGDGVPGLLCETGTGWFYKRCRGFGPDAGKLTYEAAALMAEKPSGNGLNSGALTLEDLAADSCKQLVVNGPQGAGYFELDAAGRWEPFRVFAQSPNIDLRDPSVRRIDLTGDGTLEIVVAEDEAFVWFKAVGRAGFAAAERAFHGLDEERAPAVVFAEAQQSIFLADLTGDGLTDIVRIRNGEAAYWPNHGYGKFGAKVAMANAPWFDDPDSFDPARLRLADVTGTGAVDILYLGTGEVRVWLNQAGNGWSQGVPVGGFAPPVSGESVEVLDLLGNGTPCLVWSSQLPGATGLPLRYVDLMGGRKPHLLRRYVNNLGKEILLTWRSATRDALADRNAKAPWVTRLPFPVHVVAESRTSDLVTGARMVTRFSYHHGHWDSAEREFRGFGRVDKIDTEDFPVATAGESVAGRAFHQPPTLTRTWYHVGLANQDALVADHYAGEYWPARFAERFPTAPAVPLEPRLPPGRLDAATTIADPDALARLTPAERREAARACKGLVVRQEIFALDAPAVNPSEPEQMLQATPFTVAEHACHVQLLQPRVNTAHAVFMAVEDEAFKLHYQRNVHDPRIQHSLNLRLDEQGNVLEKAEIVYGRDPVSAAIATNDLQAIASDFAGLDDSAAIAQAFADAMVRTEAVQTRDWIKVVRAQFTADVDLPETWRSRLTAQSECFEITGLARAGRLFVRAELDGILADGQSQEIGFTASPPAFTARRLLQRQQTFYYNDALDGALPFGVLAAHGLAFAGRTLAYTSTLLAQLFGTRIVDPATTLAAAGYVTDDGGVHWWIPTGTVQYRHAGEDVGDVAARFFKPVAHIDPFGSTTAVTYHKDYFLILEQTRDAVGNTARIERFDFRLMRPMILRDANDNLNGIVSDELGLVKALAHFGKDLDNDGVAELELADSLLGIAADSAADAADVAALLAATDSVDLTVLARALLKQATFRFVYDLDAWRLRGEPAVAISIARTRHHADDPRSPLHISYDYTDGSGALAMSKTQAEPGPAKLATPQPDGSVMITNVDTAMHNPPRLRWIGNGRKVLNNKGRVVRVFEPYFAVSPAYEALPELVAAGFSTVHAYDLADRLVRTDLPDGTFMRAEYGAWLDRSWDPGDTVLDSQWYHARIARLIDAKLLAQGRDPVLEQQAAIASELFSETPVRRIMDAFGNPALLLEQGGVGADGKALLFATCVVRDVSGNPRSVHDARGNQVAHWQSDLADRRNVESSMDAGSRWTLMTVGGKPFRAWDERGHSFSYDYDLLQRPIGTRVRGGDGSAVLDNLITHTEYGEDEADDRLRNLRGRMVRRWDTAGREDWSRYDSKGNLLETARRFARDYRILADWTGDRETPLEAESFATRFRYDAVNRPVRTDYPDGSSAVQRYNEANLLAAVEAAMPGQVSQTVVADIVYNANGDRISLRHGNGTVITNRFDPESRRIIGIGSVLQDGTLAQDLRYTHDVVGNLSRLADKAIPAVYFNNTKIEAVSRFGYDPLYRLVRAEGREHAGQQGGFGSEDNFDDQAFQHWVQPGDLLAWRTYVQSYRHDAVGNLRELNHAAGPGSYTRSYAYEALNNRLRETAIGAVTYPCDHHPAHGFIAAMPHLAQLRYDPRDRLSATARQSVASGTPQTTFYVYSESGVRLRKVTDRAAPAGAIPQRKDERFYLGGVEIYREHGGANAGLERITQHVMDGERRVAMLERRNDIDDGTVLQVTRYQLSNHVNSAALEVDELGRVLSYEEYHPFGTTAYQARSSALPVAARRYRYSGMERDDESGLACHGARYYIPWLGRWNRPDPSGLADGINVYQFVSGNPMRLIDPSGRNGWDRFLGGVKMVGGALETVAGGALVAVGVATSEFGVGVFIAGAGVAVTAHGADVTVSGARTMWEGEQVDTFTSQGLQELGVSRNRANLVDAGISVVGSLGASALTKAPTVVATVASSADEVVVNAPTVTRAVTGAAATTDEAASITLAFKPNIPVGHNIVGVTTGGTTVFTDLRVAGNLAESGGSLMYVPGGTGAVIGSWTNATQLSGYITTTVPITTEGAAAASRLIAASQGGAGTYSYLANNCTTYASSVLRAAGVFAPSTTPGGLFLTTALQSPAVINTAAVGGAAIPILLISSDSSSRSSGASSSSSVPAPASSPAEPLECAAPEAPAEECSSPVPIDSSGSSSSNPGMSSPDDYGSCSAEGYYNTEEQVCYSQ